MELNQKQRTTWETARRFASGLNKEINALRLRGDVISEAQKIAGKYGFVIPGADEWLLKVEAAINRDDRIQRTVSALVLGDLGIRDSDRIPGDLDVIAPVGTPDDKLVRYYRDEGHLGVPPLVIIIGVVVLIGIVAALVHEHKQASELRNVYKPLKAKADELLCSSPGSDQCVEWKAYQKSVSFEAKKSTWEKLESGARSLFEASKSGLAIAIPVVALALVWSWTKKR